MNTIITGGTRGLGLNITKYLLNNNHNVISLSKTGNIPTFLDNNNKFKNYKCDISKIEETYDLLTNITQNKKINNLIFNAGITNDSFFHKMTKEQWSNTINTNLLSLYGVVNPILNEMRKNNSGNIIFVSSCNAFLPTYGQTNYAASKAGIIAFNRCLCIENSNKNIRSNVISPGYLNTEMTEKIDCKIKKNIESKIPLNRFGNTEEIVMGIDFILNNNYVNGSVLHIDGGFVME
jgi:NAD(P)-dependent dehydrogenase (short-subunit alcohol dehydrogenase family)